MHGLSAVSTYRSLVDDFIALYKKQNSDIAAFYETVNKLANCSRKQRHKLLTENSTEISC